MLDSTRSRVSLNLIILWSIFDLVELNIEIA